MASSSQNYLEQLVHRVSEKDMAMNLFEGESDLKAKVQLQSFQDYLHLMNLMSSPAIGAVRIRTYMQQDYILDSKNYDLRKAGLTLSIRHSSEQYPVNQTSHVCTVALKESIFEDFIDIHGNSMAANPEPVYYEIRETEEKVHVSSMQEILSGTPLSLDTCDSKILLEVARKFPSSHGIRCIGSFISLRHVFKVPGFPDLEIDKVKFPHCEGFFMRFPPDDQTVFKILTFLQTNNIQYAINLKSKTTLFFNDIKEHATNIGPAGFLAPSLASPLDIGSDWNFISNGMNENNNNTAAAATEYSLDNSVSSSINGDLKHLVSQITPTSGSERGKDDARSSSSVSSPSASVADSVMTESKSGRGKRGRKTLLSKLVAAIGKVEDVKQLPQVMSTKIEDLHVDVTGMPPEKVEEVIREYHRKKNSEASARYRKRKMSEMNQLKDEVEKWKSKCEELERELARYRAGGGAAN